MGACIGRICSRRTQYLQEVSCAAVTGISSCGLQRCSRSLDAIHGHRDRTTGAIESMSFSIIAGCSRTDGRTGRTRRWRKSDDGLNARYVVGRSGDGNDRWHRMACWGNFVKHPVESKCHSRSIESISGKRLRMSRGFASVETERNRVDASCRSAWRLSDWRSLRAYSGFLRSVQLEAEVWSVLTRQPRYFGGSWM